jgi:hypothetical protein
MLVAIFAEDSSLENYEKINPWTIVENKFTSSNITSFFCGFEEV